MRDVYERKSEIPFDSDRKLMSTAHILGGRHAMVVKGRGRRPADQDDPISVRGETVEPMTAGEERRRLRRRTWSSPETACGCWHLPIKRWKMIGAIYAGGRK